MVLLSLLRDPKEEIAFLYYHMVDSDIRRKVAPDTVRKQYDNIHRSYKLAFWQACAAYKLTINDIR